MSACEYCYEDPCVCYFPSVKEMAARISLEPLKVGALFAGYGGIELALGSVLDTEPAWFSEFEAAPSRILAHHWPDVPNLGDVTKIDWAAVEPVDIITGGSPCQDLSHAGKRAGMKAGTRSGLWASMCDAIDIIRPRLVVWENVRGALSAEATSAVEPCPICVGDGGRVTLRALGRVLGDLSELGYDARWYGLRAADVGAAHGRFRVFLFAQPADTDDQGLEGLADQAGAAQAGRHGHAVEGARGPALRLLPTPTTVEGTGPGSHGTGGDNLRTVVDQLLPTPRATRGGSGTETLYGLGAERSDANRPQGEVLLPTPQAADGNGGGRRSSEGHATTLPGEVLDRLLPTPVVTDAAGSARHTTTTGVAHPGTSLTDAIRQDWREYEAAIRRQEAAFGRPAPLPTEPGAKGQPRLSPRFVEWLMALPDGWVTDVPGISRNDMLKALGNGVSPPQCAAALRAFLTDSAKEGAA